MFVSLDIYIYDEKFVLKLFMNSGWYLINSLVNWPISCYDWRGNLPELSKEFYIIDQHYWRQLQYIKLLHFISSFDWCSSIARYTLDPSQILLSSLIYYLCKISTYYFYPSLPFYSIFLLYFLVCLFSSSPFLSPSFFCLALTLPTFLFIFPFSLPSFTFSLFLPKHVQDAVEESSSHGIFIYEPHSGPVTGLSFHPNRNNNLFSCSYDGTVRCGDFTKSIFDEVSKIWENSEFTEVLA